VTQPVFLRDGVAFRITFQPWPRPRRDINWRASKRLMPGSLLALSSDNFKRVVFATVANRDPEGLLAKGGPTVDVAVAPEAAAAFDP